MNKKIGAILLALIVVVGGGAAAYAMFGGSAKQQYFKSEFNTANTMWDDMKTRYAPEFDLYEKTLKHPYESSTTMSLQVNPESPLGMFLPVDQINGSSVTLDTQSDMKNEVIQANVDANIAGHEVNDMFVRLASHDLFLHLPFMKEMITVSDDTLNKFSKEEREREAKDGTVEDGFSVAMEDIDFTEFFQQGQLPEEKELKEMQGKMMKTLYDALDDESFVESKETVDVFGESVDAKKIVMTLGPDDLKKVSIAMLELIRDDKQFQTFIDVQLKQAIAMNEVDAEDDVQSVDDLNGQIDEAIKDIEASDFKGKLVSNVWIDKNFIVQRELVMEDEETKVTVNGSHLRGKQGHQFAYSVGSADGEPLALEGKTNWDGTKTDDTIELRIGSDFVVGYVADETFKDHVRDYTYTFTATPMEDGKAVDALGSLVFTGSNSYKGDDVTSDQKIVLNVSGNNSQDVVLESKGTSSKLKAVDANPTDNVKNINDMSYDEATAYMEETFAPLIEMLESFGGSMDMDMGEMEDVTMTEEELLQLRADLEEAGIPVSDEEFEEMKQEMLAQ
ncbi:MAG TPA: DUF6583 family protein [Savagea sp.]